MNAEITIGRKTLTRRAISSGLPFACRCLLFLATVSLPFSSPLRADSNYYRHSFFDNSLTSTSYFYSRGYVSPPSELVLENGKLPVEATIYLTPPNALRFEWLSNPNG